MIGGIRVNPSRLSQVSIWSSAVRKVGNSYRWQMSNATSRSSLGFSRPRVFGMSVCVCVCVIFISVQISAAYSSEFGSKPAFPLNRRRCQIIVCECACGCVMCMRVSGVFAQNKTFLVNDRYIAHLVCSCIRLTISSSQCTRFVI